METSPRVLFFVEGFTDIRFIIGLSNICQLTVFVPAKQYNESGLKERIVQSLASLKVVEIPGNRLTFQVFSLKYLWKFAKDFDVILSQEVLRGSINANIIGLLKKIPVITYMGIAPVEYFRCKYERKQIGLVKALIGEIVIKTLMTINGVLSSKCLAMGPYLLDIALQYCPRSELGLYYGVDTDFFCPVTFEEKIRLRKKHNLPTDKFIIFFSSRISHEKDPETVLKATSLVRKQGLDAIIINLGGGYQKFIELAHSLNLPEPEKWVEGRPAVHPMTEVAEYFQLTDVMALASLAEGAAYSTLESLSCGTPVIATNIGGMAVQLKGFAQLTPRRNAEEMCKSFLWIANNFEEAHKQALRGREYIVREWSKKKAFNDLAKILNEFKKNKPIY